MKINEVTLLGHKDHGKSTMIGNLLITTGSVSAQRINDAKKTSKKLGRQFEPGFILDSFEEERTGGLTIDTTRAQILYKGKAFEFIDVPGHEELIKNMISGASNADFAVLMVSAKSDEGIRDQTLRHLYLAKMLGINKIIVAVNKMDKINYSKDSFVDIKEKVEKFLLKIGFEDKNICFVPVSAYNAENLTKKSGRMKWYKGKSLMDIMSAESSSMKKQYSPDLRISVQGSINSEGESLIIGKIISGKLSEGDNILILPNTIRSKIFGIFIKGRKAKSAAAGQNVAIRLEKEIKRDLRGSVIADSKRPINQTKKIEAIIFAVKTPGKSSTLKFNGNSFLCKISIDKVIDTTTGDTINKPLSPLNAAKVTISLSDPIIAEPFSKSEELGRFVLYDKQEFAGIGIII